MIERWVVKVPRDVPHTGQFTADSEAKAIRLQEVYGGTIHHLVEAREKVWVVRDEKKWIHALHPASENHAWYILSMVYDCYDGDVEKFKALRRQDGYTCREEWLGGGI